ncbi:YcaO-like family protein [Dietzia maris]|uniref:YcaO-like family protein n=1 Tax=Dietzia maris TaxID=37915 RepID=UPI003002080E
MSTRPLQVLPVVAVDGCIEVQVGTDTLTIDNHIEPIWSVLRYSNGRRDTAELIEACSEASGIEKDLITAVVEDLTALGVLADSRRLHSLAMECSDNPMLFVADMRISEYSNYEKTKGWEPAGEPIQLAQSEPKTRRRRRSCRSFQESPIPLEHLGELLREATDRTPSAGALYPIRLALLLNRPVGDLQAGVYHYDAPHHSLIPGPTSSSPELRHALNREDGVHNAPAVVLVAGDMQRQTQKYANRGWRYTLIEAGIAVDRIVNFAAAAGLGSLVFGGYDDAAMSRLVFGNDAPQLRSIVTVALGYSSEQPGPDMDLEWLHSYLDREFVGPGLLVQSTGSTDLWRRPGDLSFHQVLATTSPKGSSDTSTVEDRTCGGTAASTIAAGAKAIVECIERDVSGALRVDKVGTASEVQPDFEIASFVPLTKNQIDNHDYLQIYNPEKTLQWSKATNLSTGEQVHVPVDLVFYPLSTKTLGRPLLCAANSSGIASHTDLSEAQRRAFLELVERHAVLTSWHQQIPPVQVPEPGWGDYLRRRGAYWCGQGFKVRVLDYSIDGVPVAGIAIGSNTHLPGFAFGSAAAPSWDVAATKAFHEAEVAIAAQRSLGSQPVAANEVRSPLEHGRFHANDPERTAWNFLSCGEPLAGWQPSPAVEGFAELFALYQPLAVEIDSPWPINTCRVLSPRAFPISFGTALEHRPSWSEAPDLPHFIS